jgi:hypothetical protein
VVSDGTLSRADPRELGWGGLTDLIPLLERLAGARVLVDAAASLEQVAGWLPGASGDRSLQFREVSTTIATRLA